jgi:hypothetical protein
MSAAHDSRLPSGRRPGLVGDPGLRLVLLYWALILSLLAAVTLVAAGFAYGQGWCVIAGVVALRIYAWAGHANGDLLESLCPGDG